MRMKKMPKLLQLKYIALWTNHIPVSPFDDQGCFVLFIYLFSFFWALFPVAAQHNTVLVNWTTHENQLFYLVSFYYYLFIYLPANISFRMAFRMTRPITVAIGSIPLGSRMLSWFNGISPDCGLLVPVAIEIQLVSGNPRDC